MLNFLIQSYPDKRLGKCVRNNGFSLYTSGPYSTTFTVPGAKDIVRFPGVIVLWGFVISGFYCIRRKSTRLEKAFIHNAT